MKLRNIAFLAVAFALVGTAAQAGTTTNTIINGWERGNRTVDATTSRVEVGNFYRETFNIKIDAVSTDGDAFANIRFDGDSFSGSGIATQFNGGVDPFVNAGTVSVKETGSFRDIQRANISENTQFGNTSIQYSLDTDF